MVGGDNGNGAAGNGSAKQNGNKPSHLWKPGQSGNPSGRPKGSVSVAAILRRKLQEDGNAEKFSTRLWQILHDADRLSDSVKAAELFRKAIDGDKISVAEVDAIEWQVDAEIPNPVPPALETNRLSQRGES